MKYLIDTDIIVSHLRKKKYLEKKFLEKGLGISIVTLGELLYGAYKSANKRKSLEKIFDLLEDLSIEILNLNEVIMRIYAEDKSRLEIRGKRLDEFDLLIAATAKFYSLVLLTDNVKHFERISQLRLA